MTVQAIIFFTLHLFSNVCNTVSVGPTIQWRKFSFRGGGGGAKLHKFPTTLHRFARFTIVYCFTKTTLGQHIEDAIQHATQ